MDDSVKFQDTLETARDHYGPSEAICIVENEAKKAELESKSVDSIYLISDQVITDNDVTQALQTSSEQLLQINKMLLHASNLEAEEWVLVITILSSYYCTYLFASRRGFSVQENELSAALEALRECTSNFRDIRFGRALASARRYNPNPLPAPLEKRIH